ncbi:hypothetical protein [Actinomadura rubrisoli]|uniref:Uncharacterized protein n=1 Tax=Actinomadura rubrisoli TaxID=2530368 RepID=A0A4R5BWP2_9ACTN|nr:hypothetical protein [Actinomadura rubrisoli]TDD88722.1 hypothetical protein E1298_14930 [Actinomadura rubrisoli]
MTTLLLTGAAYLVTLALLAVELHETAPSDRRAWLRQQAPPLVWTVPVTAAVALFTLADTTPLHDRAAWAVVIAPAATTAAFLIALGVRRRRT